MPRIGDMKTSKFLKQSDLGEDGEATWTIAGYQKENVGTEENPEIKPTLSFHECDKNLVMNWTNLQLCAKACGTEEMNDWAGKVVSVWFDDSVMFKGEMKGGLRIKRAPKGVAPAPARAREEVPPPTDDDDIPF